MSDSNWAWFDGRRDELERMSPSAAAEAIGAEIAKLDERLAVEVADVEGRRRVIISANREAALFERVRELVASAPDLPAWDFVALRPGQGFEFEFQAGRRIDARALSFVARKTDEGVVIRLLVPNPEHQGWADIAWQIIEAGIGEQAAASLAGLEVGKREPDDHARPLEALAGYLQRHA